mgnify:CR=1 FL=1
MEQRRKFILNHGQTCNRHERVLSAQKLQESDQRSWFAFPGSSLDVQKKVKLMTLILEHQLQTAFDNSALIYR